MHTQPDGISFLICTYNGVTRIGQTLGCLAQQTVPPGIGWEVILVDNACTDGTTAEAQAHWERLGAPAPLITLVERRPGKNFAVELAFHQACYRYACIVDDDNRLASNYLQTGHALLASNPQIGILGGPNTATFEGEMPIWFPDFQHCYAVGEQLNRTGGQFIPLRDGSVGRNVLWGAGMFVRTDLWHILRENGFKSLFAGRQGNENLTAGEDDELCYAAQLLGYEVWYYTKLHLHHHMTANRLTIAYRNKLFFASVWSANRLGAYRNALWGKVGTNTDLASNMLKDSLYMGWGFLRHLVSWKSVRALSTGDEIYFMNCHHQLLTIYNFVCNFGEIKRHYEAVLKFKLKVFDKK